MGRFARLACILPIAVTVATSVGANQPAPSTADDGVNLPPLTMPNVAPLSIGSAETPSLPATPPAVTEPKPPLSPVAAEIEQRLGNPTGREREDRSALATFYEARSFEPLWIDAKGMNKRGAALAAELGKADDWGLRAADFETPSIPVDPMVGVLAESEIKLSLAALRYARHARGGRMDPTQLSNNIDRKPPLLAPATVIEDLSQTDRPGAFLRGLHPQHPQFERLRQKLLALRSGALPALAAAPAPEDDNSTRSKKKGRSAAAASPAPSVRKVLHNMEMWRWMPEDLGATYVTVNIPEFTLRVVKGGKVAHSERVITGKPDTQTPIFSDAMETVVFHPFWNVPDSIKVKEVLPGLVRGDGGLERHGLRMNYRGREIDPYSVDWYNVDIRKVHVFQPPGGANVLGVVKFLFPNKHDVYMHDTPTKHLFNANERMFSHGCMRVRNPVRLAEILLGDDKGWPPHRIAQLIHGGPQNNNVHLDNKIPVHITYFTAWVDDDDKLNLRPDPYGHEERIQMGLEGRAHLIAKKKEDLGPVRADVVSRYAESRRYSPNMNWTRSIFGFGF